MLNYGNGVNFLTFAYHQLNGEINSSVPAVSLALTESYDISDITIMGSQTMLTIEVRLNNILTQLAPQGFTDNQMRGILLYVLAHELSHCDQKKDPIRSLAKDQDYIDYMEYSNDINTIKYLKNNEGRLQSILGPYEMPDIVYNQFNKLKEKFNNRFVYFNQVSSIKEKVLDGISYLVKEDVYNNKFPLVNNINLTLYVRNMVYDQFKIIQNKNLVCGKRDIFKLSQLLARGIFDYNETSSIKGDTYDIYLALDYPPIVNAVIIN